MESGEKPAQATAREVREELGIETAVGPLLVADWTPHHQTWGGSVRTTDNDSERKNGVSGA